MPDMLSASTSAREPVAASGGGGFSRARQVWIISEDDDRLTSWSLAAIKARGLSLEGYCESDGCGQFYTFDVDGLIDLAGGDYVVPEYLPGIACDVCGGQMKFMLASVTPEE